MSQNVSPRHGPCQHIQSYGMVSLGIGRGPKTKYEDHQNLSNLMLNFFTKKSFLATHLIVPMYPLFIFITILWWCIMVHQICWYVDQDQPICVCMKMLSSHQLAWTHNLLHFCCYNIPKRSLQCSWYLTNYLIVFRDVKTKEHLVFRPKTTKRWLSHWHDSTHDWLFWSLSWAVKVLYKCDKLVFIQVLSVLLVGSLKWNRYKQETDLPKLFSDLNWCSMSNQPCSLKTRALFKVRVCSQTKLVMLFWLRLSILV